MNTGKKDTIQAIRDDVRAYPMPTSNLCYFITQTLKPKFYKFNCNLQRELTCSHLCNLLYEHTSDFILTTELTTMGNIHYHYIALFKTPTHFIRFIEKCKAKSHIGMSRVTPNPITESENMIRSKEYLIKDLEETAKFINIGLIMWQREDFKYIPF